MKTLRLPTQKQYPRRIHFGNEAYRVVFRKRLDCYGMTDSGRKVITIKDGLSPRELMSTFIHEVLHVIEFELPMRIKHKQVHQLEESIMKLLLDNFL